MTRDDKLFMIARAMARSDGHDPDQTVMEGAPLLIRGRNCTCPNTALFPIWHLYTDLASAALDAIELLNKE